MLIFDNYNNYCTIDFDNYCKNNNIVLFYMFIYSSHIFQPLNVRCFGLLKISYSKEIKQMMHIQITHIIKNNFFPALKCVFYVIINLKNIQTNFRIIGFVLYNPEKMISGLDFKFCTSMLSNFCLINFTFINPNTSRTAKNVVRNFINLKNKIAKH